MSEPKRQPRFRASFTGMVLPQTEKNIEVVPLPGPFTVEIFVSINHDYREGQWMIQLVPTHQVFGGRRFKTHELAQAHAVSLFKKQISPWIEHAEVKAKQEALF